MYTCGKPDHNGRGITHVTVRDGVEVIASKAFERWRCLASVHFQSSVTRIIGSHAFLGCTSLASINLPGSLQSAFNRCSSQAYQYHHLSS